MNAIATDDWIFLSPVNLEKLKLFHKEGKAKDWNDTKGSFVLSRYQGLLTLLESSEEGTHSDTLYKAEVKWLKSKIERITKLFS